MGVPQGSVLGPLLFIIFINDMPDIIKDLSDEVMNYADDTNVLIKANNLSELNAKIQDCLQALQEWFINNNLILNSSKTFCTVFKSSNRTIMPKNIKLSNMTLSVTSSVRVLGVQITENINWTEHINKLTPKLNSVCYCLRVLSKQCSLKTLTTVYYANFYSVMQYGVMLWGGSIEAQSVFVVQKKALRSILQLKIGQSCRGKFKSLNLLTFYGVYIYRCLMFHLNNKDLFKDFETSTNSYAYRDITKYIYPSHKTTKFEKSVLYSCIKLFNGLPKTIRDTFCNSSMYKKLVFNHLVYIEPYNVSELLL